jgi:chromosome partitioning protein
VSDAENFRTRAAEIFRQLRMGGEPEPGEVLPAEDKQGGADPTPSSDSAPPSDNGPSNDNGELANGDDPSNDNGELANGEQEHAAIEATTATVGEGVGESDPPPIPGPAPPLADGDPPADTGPPDEAEPVVGPLSDSSNNEALRLDPLADLALAYDEPVDQTNHRHPGSEHPLPRILAIANQKGGVGKTTTAVNLGAALAELGYRVLVTDLDPQGNATTGLGINGRNLDASIYDVLLHDTPVEDVIEATTLRNLFVVPATIDLAGAEIELVPVFSRELRLRRALNTVRDDFDFIIIDCPPSLGLLTVNGLAAATEVVVPIQCEYYALEGLGQLLGNVNLVQGNLNNGLELSTIILTMYDARTRLAEQVVNDVRKHFGARVCRNVVPRTVRLSEAPSFGQPIIVFDSSSRGAIAYRELAKEVSGGAPQRIR